MIKEQPDSRRFQLVRLQTLVTMENYLLEQMKIVPHWDRKNTRQLMVILDQSIAGEIEKLSSRNMSCDE